ncbi:flagellar protein FlaG [Paenibacillus sp. GCM10027627]|uniref:flagellar protein FlaG n=1 Tax=unclassified Paenibacillus TaxID=185978 RepID=UPI0036417A00
MNISSVGTTAGYTPERSMNSGQEKRNVTEAKEVNVASASSQNLQQIGEERQKHLNNSIKRVIEAIESHNTTVERSVHDETNQFVYKVKNKETGEVIKQFPEEKLLELATKLMELSGIVIDERV